MKHINRIILIMFWTIALSSINAAAQEKDPYDLFLKFAELYNKGDFIGSEKCMLDVLYHESKLPQIYYVHAYNNLGLVKKSIGLYSEALNHYNEAEKLLLAQNMFSVDLADIFHNKSRIFTFQKSYSTAKEFLEKIIRIYKSVENPDVSILLRISRAYMNIGIVYYESNDYKNALISLKESMQLKIEYSLPEIELTYLNLAKTYARLDDADNAEKFFNLSLSSMKDQFGDNYYRIPEVYFGYAGFLNETGSTREALEAHKEALRICKNIYGEKHTLTALSYKQIADFYFSHSDYPESLENYQNALIAVVPDFNDTSVFSNPGTDSSLFNIRLLEILKNKAAALERHSESQTDFSSKQKILNKSFETIWLALQVIDRIRSDYLTEESRIYLAENEKETYISAIRIAEELYMLTGDKTLISRMYGIVSRAKASVLRSAIYENGLLGSAAIPDSLDRKRVELPANIAAYNNLILEESQKPSPDSNKIDLWKDALFAMNRERERLSETIDRLFPRLRELTEKTEPLPLPEIQKKLKRNAAIIDYFISNEHNDGERRLYAFAVTRSNLNFFSTGVDSLFTRNADIVRRHCAEYPSDDFAEYTAALSYLYNTLIKPAEGFLAGNRIVIIPDEEISWLPFDAFLRQPPYHDVSHYEGLAFLINDYSFSYSHSSSLISAGNTERSRHVYAFSPDYGAGSTAGSNELLRGAAREIGSVLKSFRGRSFTGKEASEHNFHQAVKQGAILHLAMHSVTDTIDSRYSWLAFDPGADTLHDGRLYNYEISLMNISSPLVVLSACNSGTGTLYHGEGLMSMARSLVLAGASSVVRTSWEVNDETSAEIISGFYRYLSHGRSKDKSLRQAKLDFMKNSIPLLSDPYYWAGYEVTGDTAPVTGRNRVLIICISSAALIMAGAAFYLRRRRIFAERSE